MNDNLISGVLRSKGFGSNVQSVAENENAHVLAVINNALDKLNEISEGSLLDEKGTDIKPERFDIEFENVDFSYDNKRAILKDAPVIILDESTASIDPENEHLIQGAITELSKGKTVIIIAHRLATIESVDQILVVDNGCLIEKGTHAELIDCGGKYSEFVKIRQKAENWQMA